jgi:hypothetical protein
MPRSRATAPPIDPIEKDFLAALERLRDNVPRDRTLQANKARGRLKINVSTVAQEAGRSRTLIALENCKYPRVRELILLAKDGHPAEPRTSSDLIDKLRQEIAVLRAELKKAEAETAAHFHAREKADREAARWRDAHARIMRKQPAGESNAATAVSPRN